MKRIFLTLAILLLPCLASAQVVNWGDFEDNDQTIYLYFNTVGTDGVAETLTSGAIEIYEDGSDTQITSAETLTADADSRTGFNRLAIDLSDAGFENGKTYTCVLSAGTVDSVSVVNRIVGVFTVGRYATTAEVAAAVPTASDIVDEWETQSQADPTGFHVNVKEVNGTAQTARDIGASVLLSSGTGTGQVKLSGGYVAPNWGDIGNPTTVVDLEGTTIKNAADTDTQFDDLNAKLGEPVGASFSADIQDLPTVSEFNARTLTAASYGTAANQTTIIGDTNELQTDWANGGRLDLLIDSILDDTSTGVAIADGYLTEAKFGAGLIFDPGTDTVTVGAMEQAALAQFLSDDTGETVAAAGSVGLIAQGAADANAIADAVLDEALSGHTTAGTLGKAISDTLADTSLIGAPVDEESISGMIVSLRGVADLLETRLGVPVDTIAEDIAGIEAGTTQPRVNDPAGDAFTLQLSRRADGTLRATKEVNIGATEDDIAIALDIKPVMGLIFVQTVGTPTVTASGQLTCEALGPRDTQAMVQLTGGQQAGATYTVSVPVTMRTGEQLVAIFTVRVRSQ